MTCLTCTHHMHGGCVHPTSDRAFDSADTEACELFYLRTVEQPKPTPEPPRVAPVYREPIRIQRPKPTPPQRKHRDWTERQERE